MVSVALWGFLVSIRGNTSALIFFNLPATVCHEMAHWLVALLTGSRPGIPSLLPRREGKNGWTLGSVQFHAKPFAAGLVALAPALLLAPLAWWGLSRAETAAVSEPLRGLLFGYLAWGAVPSSQDWAVALKYPLGTVVALGALTLFFSTVLGV